MISRIHLETIRAIAYPRGPRGLVTIAELSELFGCSVHTTWRRIYSMLRPPPRKRLIRSVESTSPGRVARFTLTDLGRRELERMCGIPVAAVGVSRGNARIMFDKEKIIRRE